MTEGIHPLFKWFGSKWLSAPKYPEPKFDRIVEPFAGGAGYSLRYPDRKVTICETNPNLRILWPWLIDVATEVMIREIPIDVPIGTDIRTLGLSEGQSYLLKTWQRTNTTGDCWTISPWGNKPGQWTANTRARVAEEIHAIKHWRFEPDGMQRLRRAKYVPEESTWFVDPMYQLNYQYRSKFAHDYEELAQLVRTLRGQVIVCEGAEQKTGKLPTWLPFLHFAIRPTSRKKQENNHHCNELIWTNDNRIPEIASSEDERIPPMPRIAKPKPAETNKPAPSPAPVLPPKTEVMEEAEFSCDGDTTNELVVQRVRVPRVTIHRNVKSITFKDGFRLFVRPDESHDEPDARWDQYEPEDESALKQLFATYGKGHGTRLNLLLNIDDKGREEFFMDVHLPKSDEDSDAKFPMVFVGAKNGAADIVADLMYEISGKDPPDDFTTRGALEDLIKELKADVEELAPIEDLLSEFDMPGDLPSHLYSLPERLRSILHTAKGLAK